MGIELIDDSKEYELKHPSGSVFVLKHWTISMQEETDRRCMQLDDSKSKVLGYNIALAQELKVEFCLKNWKEVSLNGQEAPCVSENKKKLPVGVLLWLIREIDERAGLRMTEEEKKN